MLILFYKHGGLRCCVCEVLIFHLRIDALTLCRYSKADTIESDTIFKELTLLNDQCAYFLQIQIQLHIQCWYIVNADTKLVKIVRSRGAYHFYKHGGFICTQIQCLLRCCVCKVLIFHLIIDALTWCGYSNADTMKSDTILRAYLLF